MNYLYHIMPKDMKGNLLYPLNELKNKYPKIYKEQIKKYKNREQLLKVKIPILNCLWNDVVHLTAVNPKKISKALEKAGSKYIKGKWLWFKINPNKLIKEKAIIFIYKNRKKEKERRNDRDNFTEFNIPNLSKYNKISRHTLGYYKREIKEGRKPLIFHLVSHILYKGAINIKKAEIIKV